MISATPFLSQADIAASAGAATAAAALALGYKNDSASSATDSATAQALAEVAASNLNNAVLKTLYVPGVTATPNRSLLSHDMNVVWDVQTELSRTAALEARGSFTTKQLYVPGLPKSAGPWLLDNSFLVVKEPGKTGVTAGALPSLRNVSTYAAMRRKYQDNVAVLSRIISQSLGIEGGTARAGQLINTSAPAPANVYMPECGAWTNGNYWAAGISALDQYYNSVHESLGSSPTGAVQAVCGIIEYGYEFYRLAVANVGISPTIMVWLEGAGGQPWGNLGLGTDSWEAMASNYVRTRDWAKSVKSKDSWCPLADIVHGNADFETLAGPHYEAYGLYYHREHADICHSVFGATQTTDPMILIEQVCSSETDFADPSDIPQAQLNLCLKYPGMFGFAGAAYDVPHYDNIHTNDACNHIIGKRKAGIAFDLLANGGCPPLAIVDAKFSPGTSNVIIATIPVKWAPLVIETFSVVTITSASPAVVSWNAHGFSADQPIILSTTGALYTGLTAGTVVYVKSPTTNAFNVAATPGGAAINTSGTQSGVHMATSGYVSAQGLDFGNGANGYGFEFNDNSGNSTTSPHVSAVTLVLDGTGSPPGPGATTPVGKAQIQITLAGGTSGTGAPLGNGRWELYVAQRATGTGVLPTTAARTILRDSYPETAAINPAGTAATWHLYRRPARQTFVLKP